jgi:hypothetical protein
MTTATWRKLIAAVLAISFGLAAAFSIRWIWRDITYWSRSVTVAYKTDSLGDCVKTALADWPEVSASVADGVIALAVPGQEGALVKDTPDPQVARIVVYGHSESVSHLGPASEEPVTALLGELKGRMATRCAARRTLDDPMARKSVN